MCMYPTCYLLSVFMGRYCISEIETTDLINLPQPKSTLSRVAAFRLARS